MHAGGGDDSGPIVGINVTPLVDVCLVLVIIFMVTAPLFMQPIMQIDLPLARTQEGEEKENITVTISKEGKFALNQNEMPDIETLKTQLKRKLDRSMDRFVIVRADRAAFHGQVIAMMEMAKSLGAKSITIATEQKREN
ncbi:MAG: biopolymer transporter ExbD [Elusimicrobia bacterium]|nr:biopolymer transporter ExbD [Elusimicrobiota bacterium]